MINSIKTDEILSKFMVILFFVPISVLLQIMYGNVFEYLYISPVLFF